MECEILRSPIDPYYTVLPYCMIIIIYIYTYIYIYIYIYIYTYSKQTRLTHKIKI